MAEPNCKKGLHLCSDIENIDDITGIELYVMVRLKETDYQYRGQCTLCGKYFWAKDKAEFDLNNWDAGGRRK